MWENIKKSVAQILNWVLLNHREILEILVFVVFLISYLKKAWMFQKDDDLPDVPGGWVTILLGILGIRGFENAVGNFKKQPANIADLKQEVKEETDELPK